MARITAHLKLCPICEERLALMREVLATPATESPSPKIKEFIRNFVSPAAARLSNIVALPRPAEGRIEFQIHCDALAADTKGSSERELWRWEGSDKQTCAHVVRLEDGRLLFRLSSNNPAHEGLPFILRSGRWSVRGKLERFASGVLKKVPLPSLKRLGQQPKFSLEFPPQGT